MSSSDISILVVDDARFSTTVITKCLQGGSFTNIRHASSAKVAIDFIQKHPVSIVIADWLMPEVDGIEMTRIIRQIDESKNHYTYVIMLTAKDGAEALQHAFNEGVDDFVNKSVMQTQLLPRVFAAERLVNNQNRLLRDNQRLIKANRLLETQQSELRALCTLDSLTGLGNAEFAVNKLTDNLKHCESRGGASCYLLIGLNDTQQLETTLPDRILNELIEGISRRIKGLVRPLDEVCRISKYQFAVITHQPDIQLCEGKSFKRVKDAINHRAFKSSMGFHALSVDMSIASASLDHGLPGAKTLIKMADSLLEKANKTQRIESAVYAVDDIRTT
ncbi:putative cyclic di-GMP phosphodiesterase [BD1-7 clade bacterium]|uniref:Putative cyclic di-GMP phosphodiesterase n=1 Tax=BD1-7 clade bacterium TaxID=2029982 RepID=A0A5S9QMF2_9GAMM|nr:putative cyclic di-GMP phosphodiesterase [BD1-7 clade bacterium]CAA0119168.1 putative cyclic di-GMP phosphodiesterase [BD1-7 clade bacterium]CAA0120576.1 putative cyclic di-GMP phosphodiesterase [BD1-7 clade bacterium]